QGQQEVAGDQEHHAHCGQGRRRLHSPESLVHLRAKQFVSRFNKILQFDLNFAQHVGDGALWILRCLTAHNDSTSKPGAELRLQNQRLQWRRTTGGGIPPPSIESEIVPDPVLPCPPLGCGSPSRRLNSRCLDRSERGSPSRDRLQFARTSKVRRSKREYRPGTHPPAGASPNHCSPGGFPDYEKVAESLVRG